jgi:hypothetical protein
MFLAIAACSALADRIEVAKLYHFDTDRGGLLRKDQNSRTAELIQR